MIYDLFTDKKVAAYSWINLNNKKNVKQMCANEQHRNKATENMDKKLTTTTMQIHWRPDSTSFHQDIALSFCSSPLHDHREAHSAVIINKRFNVGTSR